MIDYFSYRPCMFFFYRPTSTSTLSALTLKYTRNKSMSFCDESLTFVYLPLPCLPSYFSMHWCHACKHSQLLIVVRAQCVVLVCVNASLHVCCKTQYTEIGPVQLVVVNWVNWWFNEYGERFEYYESKENYENAIVHVWCICI